MSVAVPPARPEPFWPRTSPHFLACRRAVAAALAESRAPLRIVVGLSGGADSLALVAALAAETGAWKRDAQNRNAQNRDARNRDAQKRDAWKQDPAVQVVAVCVDHGLQEGSGDVARQAAEHARRWGIEAVVRRVRVNDDQGVGMEAAARAARYAALREEATPREEAALPEEATPREETTLRAEATREPAARGNSTSEIWVAHTGDDQAETLLLNLLRGHANAMAPRTANLVRPLLGLRRANTEGACVELGISPWQDPHNEDLAYRRVAIRKDILPRLAELMSGDAVGPIAQAANDIVADNQELESVLQTHLAESVPAPRKTDESVLECARVASLSEPLRRRAIRDFLHAHDAPVTREAMAEIDALCTNWKGQGPVALGGRLEVKRVGGTLCCSRVEG